MTHRSAVPVSPRFDGVARGAQFRDRIAIVVRASPEAIFEALHEVALRDMKLAWALGELRYLPSRLFGHMSAVESKRPFLALLIESGTLILSDDSPHELITGSAAQLHRVNQAPRRFATPEAFDAFSDPMHEKLFMSIRVAPTGRPHEHWLVLEHATRALSPLAERKFARYWRVIEPMEPLSPGSCCGRFGSAPNALRSARSIPGGSGGRSAPPLTNAHTRCPETSGFHRPSTR
jgi:hypothetical protein